jgi:hypothetical protein
VAHAKSPDALGSGDFLNVHHDGVEEEIHTERPYSETEQRVKASFRVRDSLGFRGARGGSRRRSGMS